MAIAAPTHRKTLSAPPMSDLRVNAQVHRRLHVGLADLNRAAPGHSGRAPGNVATTAGHEPPGVRHSRTTFKALVCRMTSGSSRYAGERSEGADWKDQA
jgi:hypothetical protein